MRPIEPPLPSRTDLQVIRLGQGQPEYFTLPICRDKEGAYVSRWRLTWLERLHILLFGDLYLRTLTFGHPFQPVSLSTNEPAGEEHPDG